MEKYLSQS